MPEFFMNEALKLAKQAFDAGETPVGCVIADNDGNILGRGRNRRNELKNALAHAEIAAINEACLNIGDWRLERCAVYVTVEPCPMCAGAIVQARLPSVFFGAHNKKAGCGGSILNILNDPRFNHRCAVTEGVLADECAALMTEFFARFRR